MTESKRKALRQARTLGEYLQQCREEAGLSQRQLETISGVGRMTIGRLESNYHDEPSPNDLRRIARALELNETDLFLLAGLPVPKEAASLDIMLRKGYGVSDEEVPELKHEIEALIAKHTRREQVQVKEGDTRKEGGHEHTN